MPVHDRLDSHAEDGRALLLAAFPWRCSRTYLAQRALRGCPSMTNFAGLGVLRAFELDEFLSAVDEYGIQAMSLQSSKPSDVCFELVERSSSRLLGYAQAQPHAVID